MSSRTLLFPALVILAGIAIVSILSTATSATATQVGGGLGGLRSPGPTISGHQMDEGTFDVLQLFEVAEDEYEPRRTAMLYVEKITVGHYVEYWALRTGPPGVSTYRHPAKTNPSETLFMEFIDGKVYEKDSTKGDKDNGDAWKREYVIKKWGTGTFDFIECTCVEE